ncbi:MlaD family protein [Desulfothermus okinawensis JCM 13304]
MDRDVHYVVIGLFVILSVISLILVVIWLSNTKYKKEYKYYIVKFKESVSGLNVGSPVKYKGIKIGSVESLAIDSEDPNTIDVTVKILKKVPIKEDARAILTYQGITGLASIEIKGGSRHSKELPAREEEPYPEIKTEPSIITRLDTTLSSLSGQAEMLVRNLNYLLDKEHVNKLIKTVDNINSVVENVANHNRDISLVIKNIYKTSKELPGLVDLMAKNVNHLSNDFTKLLYHTRRDEELITKLLVSKTNDFSAKSNMVMDETLKTLKDIQNTLSKIKILLSNIEDRPSSIIYDGMLTKPGPGE